MWAEGFLIYVRPAGKGKTIYWLVVEPIDAVCDVYPHQMKK